MSIEGAIFLITILPKSLYETPEDLDHFVAGTSHDVLSQFPDYINSYYWYWSHILSSETHHVPVSTNQFKYGMLDLPKTVLTPNVGSSH